LDYEYENGRRYHAYKAGEYVLPNDEAEQNRLDLQHHIYRLCLAGRIYRAPIKNPQRVLDIGTGTGIWAVEIADECPEAVVIGTDLSPIQPRFVPPNLKFYIDDFEQPWEFGEDERFDMIHWRSLCGSTGDWPKLYKQAYDNLKPGGYLEVQEYDAWIFSDDDKPLAKAPWTLDWVTRLSELSDQFQKPLNVGRFQKRWMVEAGFEGVDELIIKVSYCSWAFFIKLMSRLQVPIGTWAKDAKLKEIGTFERVHMTEFVEAHSMALFTRVLGYTLDQANVLFSMARKDMNDRSLHLYTVYRFLYGRRPETGQV
jgi:SAM-dependent methyltransferase